MKRFGSFDGLACIGICLILTSAPFAAQAGDTKVQAIFSQRGVWDTNPMMRTHDAKTIYGSVTTPEISYTNETPTSTLSGKLRATQNFFNRSGYNSTDFHANGTIGKKNQRWGGKLQTALAYDTTRTSELSTFGENVSSTRHFSYAVTPELSHSFSQLDQFTIAPSFEKHSYDSSDYTNYSIMGLRPSYTRMLTPLTSALAQLQLQRYQTEKTPRRRVDSVSVNGGFSSRLTPEFSFQGTGGMQASQERGAAVIDRSWQWKPVYEMTLNYVDETNNGSFKIGRTQQAFASGNEYLVTTFTLQDRYRLNSLVTLGGEATYRYADYDNDSGQSLDSMFTGRGDVSYRLTRDLDLTTSHKYTRKNLTNNGGKATQNLTHIGIVYRYDMDDIAP